MKKFSFRILAIFFFFNSADMNLWCAVSSQDSLVLESYLPCEFEDGLKIVQVDRLPEKGDKFRDVKTASGTKRISRIDGFRILLTYPGTDLFVDIKAERSDPQEYLKDKKTVIEHLRDLISVSKEVEDREPKKLMINEFEIWGIDRRTLEVGNVTGVYILFSDEDRTITTIYFHNQKPERRKFQTIEEYRRLRDRFLESYTQCVKENKRGDI